MVEEVTKGYFVPKFDMVDERCTHPEVNKAPHNVFDNGVRLESLNKCPIEQIKITT